MAPRITLHYIIVYRRWRSISYCVYNSIFLCPYYVWM